MERKSGAAKTVPFSPLRQANAVFRNILDAPFRIKWPDVSVDKAALILEELKRSLTAVKRVKNRSKGALRENPSKKPRREVEIAPAASTGGNFESSGPIEEHPFDARKCSQIVVGINAVTRHLEKGNLRAGVVCLSAKPAVLQHHVLMLAVTRDARMVALPALSETISPSLGLKSVLAIGFKKLTENEDDCFGPVVQAILNTAPPIQIPWLCVVEKALQEKKVAAETANHITAEGPAQPQADAVISSHEDWGSSRKRELLTSKRTIVSTPEVVQYQTMKVKRIISKPNFNRK